MVMSFNTRSIRNKIQETTEYLKDNNIQIAFVQETWLNAGDNSILAEINDYGYNIITQNRTQRDTGGGVAVLRGGGGGGGSKATFLGGSVLRFGHCRCP